MTSTLKTALTHVRRTLASNLNAVESGVHFHAGPSGPYVCDYARCVSPQFDPERSA